MKNLSALDEPADAVDHDVRAGGATTKCDVAGGVHRRDHSVGDVLTRRRPVDAGVARIRDVRREHGNETTVALGLGDREIDHFAAGTDETKSDNALLAVSQLAAGHPGVEDPRRTAGER